MKIISTLLNPNAMREFLGKNKRRYGRGAEYAGILLLIMANAKLFQSTFEGWAIGFWGGVIFIGGIYVLFCWFVGWVDEHWGVWKHENDYGWAVTPMFMTLSRNVESIKGDVEILKAKVGLPIGEKEKNG